MKKILHTISNSGTGGGQTHLVELLKNFDRSKYELAVVCDSKGQYVELFRKYASRVYPINFSQNLFSLIKEVYIAVKKENPDIIHGHLLRGCFIGSIVGVLSHRKVFNNLHGDINDDQNQTKFKKWLYNKFNLILSLLGCRFICVSKFNADKLVNEGIKSSCIHVIYNGVKLGNDSNQQAVTKEKGIINVLSIARLGSAKGVETLMNAARYLDKNIHLHSVGDGLLIEWCRKFLNDNNLNNVTLHGFHSDVIPFLKSANIFVLASNWEGLPIAVIEAMSFHLPVVSTRVGGIPEIIHEGKGGYFIEPRDSMKLAEMVNKLAADEKLMKDFGEYNYSQYLQNLTVSKMISETEKIYSR